MTTRAMTGPSLDFDRFWRWLKDHPNCILEAGTADCALHDHDTLHWHLTEDGGRSPVVQQILGKILVGEIVLDVREALYVQSTFDEEGDGEGQCVFEVMVGPAEEPFPRYHFVVTHGYDEEVTHTLKLAQ